MANKTPLIFLCYAQEDKRQVENVFARLKEVKLNPWMDKPPKPYSRMGIKPGQKWDTVIRSTIKGADYFLAFFSKTSIAKQGYVQKEYRMALDMMNEIPHGKIFSIPVKLEECDIDDITVGTESFREQQWYDLFRDGVDDLIEFMIEDFYQDDPDLGNKMLGNLKPKISTRAINLTDREIDVLTLIAKGNTNQEISQKLYRSRRTIDGHRSRLMDKIGARNTAGLVVYAIKAGIVDEGLE